MQLEAGMAGLLLQAVSERKQVPLTQTNIVVKQHNIIAQTNMPKKVIIMMMMMIIIIIIIIMSVFSLGRYVPGYFCDVSRDSMQGRSRFCCGKRRDQKVPRYHLWRSFRAGGHRNVWCMGQTSHWSDQGDRSSNRRHHAWQSGDIIPSTAPINCCAARKRDLRSWDTVQSTLCRRVGPYQWQIEHKSKTSILLTYFINNDNNNNNNNNTV